MLKSFAILTITVFSMTAMAQEAPLTFQSWKEQQILEAQNNTLRISARINQLKSSKPGTSGSKDLGTLPNSKIKKTEIDPLLAAERDLRRSQDVLQAANTLTIEQYAMVYLPTLQGQTEALTQLSQRLSKEELAEIFRTIMSKTPSEGPKRSSSLLSDAMTVTRAK